MEKFYNLRAYMWWVSCRDVFILFQVGFFPFECVELIGEKLPSFVSGIPETPRNRPCKFR